jgi:Zn-dependent protease
MNYFPQRPDNSNPGDLPDAPEPVVPVGYQRPQLNTSRSGGSIHLFQLWGINVFLHWSWLLVAVFMVQLRVPNYTSMIWPVLEYLTLFLIVLMHEFGHALACRSVGGTAERIVLWPLGGVAFVSPPPRAGPLLWSIVAGPLVNVLLVPVTVGLHLATRTVPGDVQQFFYMMALINAVLLVFNLLPIYPLDGGQILRALLWFVIGRARSLLVAAVIGLLGAASVIVLALWRGDLWLGLIAVFGGLQSWNGFKQATALQRMLGGARHQEYACPHCHEHPPAGTFWQCDRCGHAIDAFEVMGFCPICGQRSNQTPCPTCGIVSPPQAWLGDAQEVETPAVSRYR